jgi:hypothetical protein
MHVGFQSQSFFAHYKRHLRVGLQLQKAVDHLDSSALHVLGIPNVCLLVESSLEFD